MIRWLIWSVYVVGWTVALEMPVPPTERLPGAEFVATYRYVIAKTIHVAVYTGMTMLSGWLGVSARHRSLLIFFLMAHAGLTELLQEWLQPICHRGGSVTDVALDYLGIGIGIVASWPRWTGEDPAPANP